MCVRVSVCVMYPIKQVHIPAALQLDVAMSLSDDDVGGSHQMGSVSNSSKNCEAAPAPASGHEPVTESRIMFPTETMRKLGKTEGKRVFRYWTIGSS